MTQVGDTDPDRSLREALLARQEVAKREAGSPYGRGVPAIVVGAQRYPDPSMWGPNIETPLTLDEKYGDAMALDAEIVRLAEQDKEKAAAEQTGQ